MIRVISISGMFAVLLFMAGCAGRVELRPLSDAHPASPRAIQAPVDAPQQVLIEAHQDETAAPTPAEAHQHEMVVPEMDGDVIYSYSMHKEIRSKEPGNCPICGMTLIKVEEK